MSRGTILVTGAGGFIGCRVVEFLHLSGMATPRAGVRRWSSAARLGRLPVDIVQCDVTDQAQVADAVRGVDAIVHCAVGDRSVTVDGTRNLLEAAHQAGVTRVVYLSTIDVYGQVDGVVNEDLATQRTGNAYGDTKIEAEELCRSFNAKGLPVVILRPTLVYGPFSANWTIMYAQRLAGGEWFLPEKYCGGNCNLVYVDDLMQAIELGLTRDEAVGGTFNINGDGRQTWQEYFQALNDALGLPPLTAKSVAHSRARAAAMMPARKLAKFLLANFRGLVMGLSQRSSAVKNAMRQAEAIIRQTPVPAEFATYGRQALYDAAKAKEVLGYHPEFSMGEGVELSGAWLRHHGYVPGEPSIPLPETVASSVR